MYDTGNQIKFKTSMLRSILCDHSDAYILVKGTLTVSNTETAAAPNNRNKKVILKNHASFTDCMSEINNKEIDRAKHIDVVMPMYNLVEYSDNFSTKSGRLWQYYRAEPFIKYNGGIIDVPNDSDESDSDSFEYKQKITGQAGNYATKNVQIMVPLK